MQATLRSTAAAALVLLAPAAALVAAPAAAQQRATQPSIASLSVNADHGVAPGSTLRFQVRALPNARQAELVLGSSGIVVPLAQQGAGNYTGSYVVRRSDRIDPSQAIAARVRHGSGPLVARNFDWPAGFQDVAAGAASGGPGRDLDRGRAHAERRGGEARRDQPQDQRPPQITDMAPAHGDRIAERGRTQLSARLSDEGVGIDPDSVRLRLAGRDVTRDARITPNEISYRGDLAPGRYTADLQVKDFAGNMTRKTWSFDIVDRDRDRDHNRVGVVAPMPLEITSHQDRGVVDLYRNVQIQGRTLPNATVRVQVDFAANMTAMLGVPQQVADITVQADRNGVFSAPIQPRHPVLLPGSRYDVRLTATSGGASVEERLVLTQRG